MFSSENSTVKYIVGAGLAIGTLAVLWKLSNDGGDATELDFGKEPYTQERLKEVLGELELEFTCIYARVYNLMQKLKENKEKGGSWDDDMLRRLEASVNEDKDMKTRQVIE